jgi:hypothetical protein
MKLWPFIFLIIPVVIFWWVGLAGKALADCYWSNSVTYQEYPFLYQSGMIDEGELNKHLKELRYDNATCQAKVAQRYYVNKIVIILLTQLTTKGKGLP